MSTKKILIVDDEINIIDLIAINLKARGYETLSCLTGEEAIRLTIEEQPDLIILDLMLPGINGLDVCRTLKNNPSVQHIPIIMVTAKVEEEDKIIGLELGADDYITKPFSVKELVTRVNVALRRLETLVANKSSSSVVQYKDLCIEFDQFKVSRNDQIIELTLKEFSLFQLLIKEQSKIVSREQLLQEISKDGITIESRTVDYHITNIRKKLGKYQGEDDYIETVRGRGYRIS